MYTVSIIFLVISIFLFICFGFFLAKKDNESGFVSFLTFFVALLFLISSYIDILETHLADKITNLKTKPTVSYSVTIEDGVVKDTVYSVNFK